MREGMSLDGGTPPSFYIYVNQSETAAYAQLDAVGKELYDRFAAAFAEPGEPYDRLVNAIERTLEWLLEHPDAMRLWFVGARRTDDAGLQARRSEVRARIIELITRPEEGCVPGMPDLHVEFLFGALAHAAHDELASGGDCAEAGRRIRELLELFDPVAA